MRLDLDFNLLKTLVVLADKKSLKKAGVTLGLTDSAVSKQLARLREQLNDELFIRLAGQFEPTSYTLSILPKLKLALTDLEEAIQPNQFDPLSYADPIHIALPDLVMERFGLALYQSLQQQLPQASITLHAWGDETENKLVSGQMTLGVHLLTGTRLAGIYQKKICDDQLTIAIAAQYAEYQWSQVKKWPFIKQRAIGWNEQKFQFIEHLQQAKIDLNYAHEIDTASFALKLMNNQKVANVLPLRLQGTEFVQVKGAEFVNYPVAWALNTRVTDRHSPLNQYLLQLITQLFITNPKT
ncbi:LysR family transcriptional regulator [Shewanella sp. GD04112]|uniref:LysR family transcriptional regulator n=1 Tax=Shewanella sp. GD04112 TaxID=2975434 RepID=UPI000B3431BB|nr:LysR family transcriptional regulator [Shewanella sp. GD04112]MDH0447582.1 LysR family transcriptional regulator [Shewanella sp. GD04112]QXN24118.1 LysR family transcriptional regulator [Shewanella putrefaciens]